MNQAEFEANFDADVLDFNQAHRTRNISQNERFSITKLRQMLNLEDIDRWIQEIQLPKTNNYKYPSSLELGLIHQQSCYLQPDPKFLKTCKIDKCECCGQKIRKRKISFWSCDMYETVGKEYGLYLPIYFSIQKLNIIILVLLGLIFGGYFCYMSHIVCHDEQFIQDLFDITDPNETIKQKQDSCNYQSSTNFIPQELLINYLYQNDNLNGYLWLTYWTFFLILCTPFMHEILIKQRLVQYWNYDINNHRHPSQLTLYIKHLPKKFSEQEIMLYILNAVQHEQKKQPINYSYIDELVYIYDTHPISQLNQQRSNSYLQLLSTALELKEFPDNLQNKEKLIDLIQDLMRQTKQIQFQLKSGLPFTSKVIIKFSNETITNKVFNFYYKDLYHKITGQYKALNKSARDLERQKALQMKLEMQVSHSEITPGQSNLKQIADLGFLARSSSIDMEQAMSSPNKKKDLQFSLAELINFNQVDIPPTPSPLLVHDEMKKDLHMQRGFSQDDIFWENMGMNTLKRLILRIETTTVTIVAGLLSMALFMWMFYEEQKLKVSSKSGFIVNIVILIMVIIIMSLSVLASIIVIKMTVNSKRSTYSLQEKNMITFMGPIQQLCIISFPYFLALSYPTADGVMNSMPIYTIYFLAQIRIVFKGIIHIFHLRAVGYYFTKKKIMKKFNPNLYFQKQLNQLLTPGYYPIRSRVLYQFFIFSTGLLMMLLAPFINLFCVLFLVFFYFFDKYCLLHVYTIDKQFTYQLLNYLVITQLFLLNMQQILNNNDSYLFNQQIIKMAGSQWQYMGYGTGAVCFIVYVTLRKRLARFWVYKICRYHNQIQNPSKFNEKSYFQSYNDYFDNIGVEELNQLLITTFKSMQYGKLPQPE